MDKLKLLKFAAGWVVGSGTGIIVGSIIRDNVHPKSLKQKIAITAATFIIGSMAASATKNHTEQMIDDLVEAWTNAKAELEKAGELIRETVSGEY